MTELNELLARDYALRRTEILDLLQRFDKCLFGFITTSGLFVGLYFSEDLFKNAGNQFILIFVLSQIQILISFFATAVLAGMQMNAGYCEALETFSQEKKAGFLSLWESQVTRKIVARPFSTNTLSLAAICLPIIAADIYVVQASFCQSLLLSWTLIAELLVLFWLLFRAVREKAKARAVALAALRQSFG